MNIATELRLSTKTELNSNSSSNNHDQQQRNELSTRRAKKVLFSHQSLYLKTMRKIHKLNRTDESKENTNTNSNHHRLTLYRANTKRCNSIE